MSSIKKGINFSGIELFEILLKVDFDALVEFLHRHGGLNGVEEYGRTALMELTIGRVRPTVEFWNAQEGGLYAQEGRNELMKAFFRRCRDFSLEYLLRFENEFAQKLVELGCNINQRDRYGFTALRYAVQPAKDLSRIKIQKELNRPERKEGTGNQAHHSGPEDRYGKWTAKRQAKLVRRVCCLS